MSGSTDPRAGERPQAQDLIDVDELVAAYGDRAPDGEVSFGTSGHRGSSLDGTFQDAHVAAVAQAIAEHRAAEGIDGPLFVGRDTHALSEVAQQTLVEVLSANGVDVVVAAGGAATPTPVISHAILTHNRGSGARADGVVITPSHNPPRDGGVKYNPPHGGPAGTDVTGPIQDRANQLLDGRGVKRGAANAREHDYVTGYVDDLPSVVDLAAIRDAGVRIGVDPLGGASLDYWAAIAERHGLDLTITSDRVDPTFSFVPLDHDGRIRMDCSSPYAMRGLLELADGFDLAVANDPDADRHGIVTPGAGLLNPNHALAAAIAYLFGEDGRGWPATAGIGKTLVSSSVIDHVARDLGRTLVEVPVGFKWFVDGLLDGTFGFGGEESAGASFLRMDGGPWSTDKDGLIPCLLAAEQLARTGVDPGQRYAQLIERFGLEPTYTRIDVAASPQEKDVLKRLDADAVEGDALAGEPITAKLTEAPGNGAPLGGLKVVAEHGWFAARPSGTEDIYKVYAESLDGRDRLERIVEEAQELVGAALKAAT